MAHKVLSGESLVHTQSVTQIGEGLRQAAFVHQAFIGACVSGVARGEPRGAFTLGSRSFFKEFPAMLAGDL